MVKIFDRPVLSNIEVYHGLCRTGSSNYGREYHEIITLHTIHCDMLRTNGPLDSASAGMTLFTASNGVLNCSLGRAKRNPHKRACRWVSLCSTHPTVFRRKQRRIKPSGIKGL